jgi:hypothetical protein
MKTVKTKLVASLLTICTLAILITACQKTATNNLASLDTETMFISEDDAIVENTYNDLFDDVMGTPVDDIGFGTGVGIYGKTQAQDANTGDAFARTGSTDSLGLPPCATITVVPNLPGVFPKVITIDFGTVGCAGPGGHIRKGKIVSVYTNRMFVPGAKATTTFIDFYFDTVKVEGTYVIENQSTAGTPTWNVKVIDGKLTKPSGNYINRNSSHTTTQVAGVGTRSPIDDVFEVTGRGNSELKRGSFVATWTHVIEQPLVKRFTCRWFVKGIVKITKPSGQIVLLNYAPVNNGECDNKASITKDGVTEIIVLPRS